jgi:DNA-directed RNA polymerase subunit H (RpoH/RPB5)
MSIEYTHKEILSLIIENTLKMLSKRNLFDEKDIQPYILNINFSKNIFEIKLNNNSLCGLYLLNTPITTIISGTPLDEYLSENINVHKILIAKSVSKKVVKQLYQEYKNVEFFFETEMLEDKSSILFIPQHRILSKEEINNLHIEEHSLAYLKLFDAMVRYYNGKVGDIFEITRHSIVSGYSIDYKKVVLSSSDLIFPI